MQEGTVKVGEYFSWKPVGGGQLSQAVVTRICSDQQEGLSPESEEYAAFWIEAQPVVTDRSEHPFTIMVGTDGRSYLEGKEIAINRGRED